MIEEDSWTQGHQGPAVGIIQQSPLRYPPPPLARLLPLTTSVVPDNFLQTDFKRIKNVARLLEFSNPQGLDEI